MQLDIRLPMGAMFGIIGAILTVYGAIAGPSQKSLGINIDLIWGMVMFLFGAVMLILATNASRAAREGMRDEG